MKELRENSIFYVLMLVAVLAIYTKTKEINDNKRENISIGKRRNK